MKAVDFCGVSKTYKSPNKNRVIKIKAVDNVSLCIEPGEFFGLLGPNSAGKTTLISILAGLVRPDFGTVHVMGCDVNRDCLSARKMLGVMPQEIVFDPFFTVRETLDIQLGFFGLSNQESWIDEVLNNLGLQDKANANMRTLSGGMKRRVLLAQAIIHKPPVIVLDEPTAGVDVQLRQALWKFIARLNREGHTILLTTHYLEEAENLCGRIAMLKQGKIIALDHTKQLLAKFSGLQLIIHTAPGNLTPELCSTIANFDYSDITVNGIFDKELALTNSSSIPKFEKTTHNNRLRWHLSSYNQIEPLLAICRNLGVIVSEIELSKANLEDVFVELMRKEDASIGLPC